jgi:hypothetical protein
MVWLDERLREGWPNSPLETITDQIFTRYPLPKPTKQFTIYQDRHKIKRVDFAYPAWTVIVEADSGRWHSDIRHRQADIDDRNT